MKISLSNNFLLELSCISTSFIVPIYKEFYILEYIIFLLFKYYYIFNLYFLLSVSVSKNNIENIEKTYTFFHNIAINKSLSNINMKALKELY